MTPSPAGNALAMSVKVPERSRSLEDRLKQRIETEGPITVAAFMEAALTDPDEGYYQQCSPFGADGDFITSPEICQIFGELIGLWSAEVWRAMGAPATLRLIELGPGRGTLMKDAFRALAVAPEALGAAELHFVETSSRLRAEQRRALAASPPVWHDELGEVPRGPAIIIANEFVDAIAVRQFVRRPAGWHERCVGLGEGGSFVFTERESPVARPERFIAEELLAAEVGSIVEARPLAQKLISEIGSRAESAPTAALIIDYGHARSGAGDTLQAMSRHQPADPLGKPGSADLTAHVDFAALARFAAAAGLAVFGPMPQGQFLLSLGLAERADRLIGSATPGEADLISSAARRLVDPRMMGDLFKVLVLADPDCRPPPPFQSF